MTLLGGLYRIGLLGSILVPCVLADTYRWVDPKGEVHYSDQVPPDQIGNRRAKLNARGFEVDVIEAPKTPEQQRREQLLKQLRSQQERVLNEQRDQDRALMRTYRSTDEILLALKVKLDGLDNVVKLTRASSERETSFQANQEQRNQSYISQGQATPQVIRDSLNSTARRITAYKEQIERTENEKLATTDRFSRDIRRFQAIRAMQQRNENLQVDWSHAVSMADVAGKNDIIISAIQCSGDAECAASWLLAKDYLTGPVGRTLSVETEKILQTPYPANDTDFGITVTRIPGNGRHVIFLDVVCRPTSIGEQLCKGERVRGVRSSFITAMKATPELGQTSPASPAQNGRPTQPPP
jgi:hypothetical protein